MFSFHSRQCFFLRSVFVNSDSMFEIVSHKDALLASCVKREIINTMVLNVEKLRRTYCNL
ncbi:MAG: hypothetical protein R3B65_00610 [Candidatus Paceibacterota bacterium]